MSRNQDKPDRRRPIKKQKLALETKVAAHYDSMTQEELVEQAEWGAFALREFPDEHKSSGTRRRPHNG